MGPVKYIARRGYTGVPYIGFSVYRNYEGFCWNGFHAFILSRVQLNVVMAKEDKVLSVAKCRGSWVVGRGRGSWVWVWVWVNVVGKKSIEKTDKKIIIINRKKM